MPLIGYRENSLYCEDVLVAELAEEYGTPLYVYSRNRILENYRTFARALEGADAVVCYALKANSNPAILKMLADEGAGADVVSSGELHLAGKAGFARAKTAFAGVGKREDEIAYALDQGIASFNVESLPELQLLSLATVRKNVKTRVSLRINPDIDAQSHPYITTGLNTNKFGIEASKALEAFTYAASLPGLDVKGVHIHIGSQIITPDPFVAAAKFLADFVPKVQSAGVDIRHIDFGGGFGVPYYNAVRPEAIPAEDGMHDAIASPADILVQVRQILDPLGCSLWLEPGRAIVADAGFLVTRVLYHKETSAKKFLIVDAAMTDLLRPSLYNAHHQIVPCEISTFEHELVDVVGPVCESGDFLARERAMNKMHPGEYAAVMTAGAYGFALSSHYNSRPRPAEVLINGDRVRIVRQRETFEDL